MKQKPHVSLSYIILKISITLEVLHVQQTDVIRVLQGKLEGCTVNSQGVILNHTTYYLNPDAHIFN